MANTPRLAKLLALAVVIAAIIASSGLVSALDATSPGGSASASPVPTAEDNSQGQPQSQAVIINSADDTPRALTIDCGGVNSPSITLVSQ